MFFILVHGWDGTGMGFVLVPLLLWLWARGSARPYRLAGELLATIFGAGLGLAVSAHLLIGAVV